MCPFSVVTYSMLHTVMTSCLRNVLVRVCLAIIVVPTLTAFSHRIFKHRQYMYWQKYFTWKYQTMLHFLCSCSICSRSSYLLSFHWHIRIKSTAYFFVPPCTSATRTSIVVSRRSVSTSRIGLQQTGCDPPLAATSSSAQLSRTSAPAHLL